MLREVTPSPLQTPPPRRPSPRRAPPPWAPSPWAPRAAAPTPTHRVRAPTFRRAARQRPRCPPAAAAARSARRAGAAAGKASGRTPGSFGCDVRVKAVGARAGRATAGARARARDTVGARVRVRVRVGVRVGVWARVRGLRVKGGHGGREADRRRPRGGRGRGAAARRCSAARGGAALQLGHLALHLLPRLVTLAQHPRHGLRTRLGGLGRRRGGRRGLGLGGLGGTLLDRHLAIRRANLLPRRLAPRPGLLLPLRCQRLVPQTLVLLRSIMMEWRWLARAAEAAAGRPVAHL